MIDSISLLDLISLLAILAALVILGTGWRRVHPRQNDAHYRSLFQASPMAIWEEDFSEVRRYLSKLQAAGISNLREYFSIHPEEVEACIRMVKILDVNQSALALFKAGSKEELHQGLGAVTDKETLAIFIDELIALTEGRTHFETEAILHNLAGDELQVTLNLSIAPGYLENWAKVFVTIHDITERRRLTRQTEERRLYLERVLASAPDAVVTSDTQHKILEWNPGAEKLFGYSREEAIGRKVDELITGGDARTYDEANRWTQQVLAMQGIPPTEAVRYRKDGSRVDVLVSVAPITIVNEWIGTVAVYTDIGERKQAEKELKEYRTHLEKLVEERTNHLSRTNEQLQMEINERTQIERALSEQLHFMQELIDAIPAPIFYKGVDGRYLGCNLAFEKRCGRKREEIIGKQVGEVFTDEKSELFIHKDMELFANPGTQEYEAQVLYPDGSIRDTVHHKATFYNTEGKLSGMVGVLFDVTDRNRTRDELQHYRDQLIQRSNELEAINKELEAFAYSVSHDLRAPLRGINGYARVIQEDFGPQLSPQVQAFLQKILDSSYKMEQLIDDLLSFTRLGRKPMEKRNADMAAIVRTAISLLEPETMYRQLEWVVGELPPAYADPALIEHVYTNLIGNAVKYSRTREKARIEIGSFEQEGEIVYFVRDNGVGFDMQYADKLFGVLQRLHSASEFEGTGIGLAIVQRILLRHGGRIWAEAEVDKGATFYFTLPGG